MENIILKNEKLTQLNNVINLNKKYLKKQEELKKELEELKEINNTIDLDYIKTLTYEEIKELKTLIEWKVNKDIKDKIIEIYNAKKIEKFPILKKVRYFPIINEINFLTEEQKVNLDKYLASQAMSYYLFDFRVWFNLKFSENETKLIQSFLHNKGIIRAMYYYETKCKREGEWYSEEDIEKYKEKFKNPENWETLCIYCDCCDDIREISTIEELEKYNKIGYKLKNPADRSSNNL